MTYLETAITGLVAGQSLDDLGIARTDEGRWDLRSATIRRIDAVEPRIDAARLAGVSVSDVDFSGVSWDDARWDRAFVTNCVFDRAQLSGWRQFGTIWRRCSFREAVLRDFSMFGRAPYWRGGHGVVWDQIDFTRARFVDVGCHEELYLDCDFSNAILNGIDFGGASHRRSIFAGLLNDVTFRARPLYGRRNWRPNPMECVSFANARLRHCRFVQLDLADVEMPGGNEHIVFRPKVETGQRVLRELRRLGEPDWGRSLSVQMKVAIEDGPARRGAWGVVDMSTLSGSPEGRRRAADLLRSCAGEVQPWTEMP